jgi:hypothetical protein
LGVALAVMSVFFGVKGKSWRDRGCRRHLPPKPEDEHDRGQYPSGGPTDPGTAKAERHAD